MDNTSREEFLNQMKTAIDLETEIATQNGVIDAYTSHFMSNKPVLKLIDEPAAPIQGRRWSFSDGTNYYSSSFCFGIVSLIMAVVFLLVGLLVHDTESRKETVMIFGIIFGVLGIISMLPAMFKGAEYKAIDRKNQKIYLQQLSRYKKECIDIRQQNSLIKAEHKNNVTKWQSKKNNDLSSLSEPLEKTKELLKEVYDINFIYAKYRNLPALTSIYEYFITGRCDELIGPHGAYNLYEDEVRKDTVISQLSAVLEHLEQIKQNQYMLYQQVTAMRKNLDIMSQEIAAIRGYTGSIMELSAVSAYYSALTARNTEISATMHLLNG